MKKDGNSAGEVFAVIRQGLEEFPAIYLEEFFRELELLLPTCGTTSHSVGWDSEHEDLVLLCNFGDEVAPVYLREGDLTSDPAAAVRKLYRLAERNRDLIPTTSTTKPGEDNERRSRRHPQRP
jgi:hypothetical protein